jgi:hypothetical protein
MRGLEVALEKIRGLEGALVKKARALRRARKGGEGSKGRLKRKRWLKGALERK